ncbi:MAG: hypothetical protein E7599_04705 [Ruminococcaceae bacterium]|nr:hypothetical protein [Oscillospiraceae bacterium]
MSSKKRILSFILVLMFIFSSTGLRPATALEAPTEIHTDTVPLSNASLPSAVNLVGSKHLPPIANQGAVGCCASMAATYLQFTNAYSRYLHSIDPNTDFNPASGKAQYNFSPRFTYNLAGSGTAWVYEVLKEQGTVLQTYSTFSGGVTGFASDNALANDWATIDGYWTEAMKYRIRNYDQVWMSGYDFQLTTTTKGNALLARIKSALNEGNVIVTGGYPDRWDYTTVVNGGTYGKKGQQVIYRSTNRSSGGHQVAIVGYDDDLTCTVNGITLKGAFLVANSWGTTWKNNGYTWVMYDAVNQVSAYSSLNHTDRQWTLDQFVFLDWKTDLLPKRPALSAKIEITTADRNGFSVTMTRTDMSGNTESYVPYIVQNENRMPKYNTGLNFYGRTGAAKGYLNYSFGPLLDLPTESNLDDYVWGITVSADNGKSMTVGGIELLDENAVTLYQKTANQALSSGQTESYLFSDLYIVQASLPDGAVLQAESGSALCEKGSTYRFTVKAAEGFSISHLRVSANGQVLSTLDGVYSVTVDENTLIEVSGIVPASNTIKTSWYGTGFENWSGKYLMLVMVENKYLDPDVYASETALNSGSYPYYFRVTVDGKQTYYFTPHSFYRFDSSTLYRLPVVDQGWIPQNGTTYSLVIEVCTEHDILYKATQRVTCKVGIEQSYTAHTHSFTSDRRILVHEGDCSHGGSYDRFCDTVTCRAAKSYESGTNANLHSARYSVTVDPTPLANGSYTVYCSSCGTELSKEILDKIFPTKYDLDRSGTINISDVNEMLVYLSSYESITEEDLAVYDLDCDGTVSVSDLNTLLIYLSLKE